MHTYLLLLAAFYPFSLFSMDDDTVYKQPHSSRLDQSRLTTTAAALAYARELHEKDDSNALEPLVWFQEAHNVFKNPFIHASQKVSFMTHHQTLKSEFSTHPIISPCGKYGAALQKTDNNSQAIYVYKTDTDSYLTLSFPFEKIMFDFDKDSDLLVHDINNNETAYYRFHTSWDMGTKTVSGTVFSYKSPDRSIGRLYFPEEDDSLISASNIVAFVAHKAKYLIAKAYVQNGTSTYIEILRRTWERDTVLTPYARYKVPGIITPHGVKWHPHDNLLAVQTCKNTIWLLDMRVHDHDRIIDIAGISPLPDYHYTLDYRYFSAVLAEILHEKDRTINNMNKIIKDSVKSTRGKHDRIIDIADVSCNHYFDFDGAGNRLCMANTRGNLVIFDISQQAKQTIHTLTCISPGIIQQMHNDIFAIGFQDTSKNNEKPILHFVDINTVVDESWPSSIFPLPKYALHGALIQHRETGSLFFYTPKTTNEDTQITAITYGKLLGTQINRPRPYHVAILHATRLAQNDTELQLLQTPENKTIVDGLRGADPLFDAFMRNYVKNISGSKYNEFKL